jgi:hypothetical protein
MTWAGRGAGAARSERAENRSRSPLKALPPRSGPIYLAWNDFKTCSQARMTLLVPESKN